MDRLKPKPVITRRDIEMAELESENARLAAEVERLRGCKFSDRNYNAMQSRAENAETTVERLIAALREIEHISEGTSRAYWIEQIHSIARRALEDHR